MMFMSRHGGGRVLRVFALASAIAVGAGAIALATRADAAAVSAPVIGQLWATLSLMRESDEFVRAVTAKQFIVSAGLAMALATFWGFAETFAAAPHLPGWLIYAAFWAFFGCVAPFIRASN